MTINDTWQMIFFFKLAVYLDNEQNSKVKSLRISPFIESD